MLVYGRKFGLGELVLCVPRMMPSAGLNQKFQFLKLVVVVGHHMQYTF